MTPKKRDLRDICPRRICKQIEKIKPANLAKSFSSVCGKREPRCRHDKRTELIGGRVLETLGLTLCCSSGLEQLEYENMVGENNGRSPSRCDW